MSQIGELLEISSMAKKQHKPGVFGVKWTNADAQRAMDIRMRRFVWGKVKPK